MSTPGELDSRRRIAVGAIASYVAFGVNVTLSLLFIPWMITQLGPSDYGLYVLGISLTNLFLTDLGLSNSSARFLARRRARGDDVGAAGLLSVILRLYVALDVVIAIALGVLALFIGRVYPGLTAAEHDRFLVVYLIVACVGVATFPFAGLGGAFVAYERFAALRAIEVGQRLFSTLLIGLALSNSIGLYGLVAANSLALVVGAAAKATLVSRILPFSHRTRLPFWRSAKPILKFTLWTSLATVSGLAVFTAAPSLIAMVASSTDVGMFGIASSVEGNLYGLTAALNGLFLSTVSRIGHNATSVAERITQLVVRVARLQLLIVGAAFIGLVFFGSELITAWLGPGFQTVYVASILLLLPSLFYLPLEVANSAILAQGHVRPQAIAFLAMGVTSLTTVPLLAYHFGAVGAAMGVLAAYTVRNLGLHLIYARRVKLDLRQIYRHGYLRVLPALAAGALVAALINVVMPSGTAVWLVAKLLAFGLLYGAIALTIGIDRAELQRLAGLVKAIRPGSGRQ